MTGSEIVQVWYSGYEQPAHMFNSTIFTRSLRQV